MKIRKLTIKNLRGIKELDWVLPLGDIFCLIGKGDSSKSTILDAIRYTFYPSWNLTLCDSDFHQCNTDCPIIIEISIGELLEEFCSLSKYGHCLRGWDSTTLKLSDEPEEHHESILTIRLTIEKDLEPKWLVVSDRNPEGVPFKQVDRNKVSVSLIGAYSEKQLSWATGTALAKLTEAQNLNQLLADASRTARTSLDADRSVTLKNFDEAAQKSQNTAKILGVPVLDAYRAHLDLNSINLKVGGLALHDGDIPLRQLGMGSRRMLLCGIQQLGLEEGHITLFDEVEFGLEPYRIARLIKHVRGDKHGQYFMTTHSPIVLRELTAKELFIVHNISGTVSIISASDKCLEKYEIQGKIRTHAEALLAKKVIVCEGATEVGFLRGLDDYQLGKGKDPFSFQGVALLDAGGCDKVKTMAKAFYTLGYQVAVLADADAEKQFSASDMAELGIFGVPVFAWTGKLAIEQRAMLDLPWSQVLSSLKLAQDELHTPVYDHVHTALKKTINQDVETWEDSSELRQAIGLAAKKGGWFKSMTKGDQWFKVIAPAYTDAKFLKTDLATKLNELWAWVEHA